MSAKRYDKSYFDKWYRNPSHRVSTSALTARKALLVVSIAEYYLERPVRTVLDVGCGEGQWLAALKKLRPAIRYTGIDSSEYVIGRYGRLRNLKKGNFGNLHQLNLKSKYDLIICSDLLYYIESVELSEGLKTLVSHLGGVAFLEAYATKEAQGGDLPPYGHRTPEFYRRLFRQAGLRSCGSHCYVGPTLSGSVTSMENGGV